MRTKLVAGNWKMNGSLASNAHLLSALASGAVATLKPKLAVCVPYPYLAQASAALAGTTISVGAQDLSEHAQGAYTGEVSGAMLADFACRYVLVGHSERRSFYGDSDAVVAAKFAAACNAGLIPILCVGETLAERESGATASVVERQLAAGIAELEDVQVGAMMLAYEPVWAIGTGKTATPDDASDIHGVLRRALADRLGEKAALAVPILYGGSVNRGNAGTLLAAADVDGLLVGGASLDPDGWSSIVRS